MKWHEKTDSFSPWSVVRVHSPEIDLSGWSVFVTREVLTLVEEPEFVEPVEVLE